MSPTRFKFLRPRSRSIRSNSCLSNNSKTTEANLTDVQRKIKHHEKVCFALKLGFYRQGEGHISTHKDKVIIRSEFKLCLKSCLSYNSKTTQANLMKLHRKIKHNEKVCHTQGLGYHTQGQAHNQGSEIKSNLCDYLKLAGANFVKLHKKVNHN